MILKTNIPIFHASIIPTLGNAIVFIEILKLSLSCRFSEDAI